MNCKRCGGSLRATGGCGQCEQREARATSARVLGPDWLTREAAARQLNVDRKTLTDHLRQFLTHKSASLRARGARHVGYVYRRADVECAARIRKALGCTARRAVETLSALRMLRRLGLLDEIEKQLTLTLEDQ